MKKKYVVILLVLILLVCLGLLIGYSSKNKKQLDNNESTTNETNDLQKDINQLINDVVNALSRNDADAIFELLDVKSYVTLLDCYTEDGIDNFNESYKKIEEEYNSLSEEQLEALKIGIKKQIESSNEDTFDVEINFISKCSEIEDAENLYSVDVKYTINGENTISTVFYLYEVDDELYFACFEQLLEYYLQTKNLLEKVEDAKEKTKKSMLKEIFMLINSDLRLNNLGLEEDFTEYVTLKMLNEKLEEHGYILCERNKPGKKIDTGDELIPYGEEIYISEINGNKVYTIIIENNDLNWQIDIIN